ncbi:unnamed protein product [Rotaria magnacalcarata]|uniref:SMP-30/Gluconolactonase/LRE-like region domain-containing protein n=1 Tax=Rotaria magnacalcarata TaxID=392030 RepID=A0A816RJY6_9BILA|nr:unnamed protein product [Rotaria magnacalcarata]CAF1683661.1 unnamed protein product [Rotaria magnacalcarata]CAF2072817.1 unnamed protein product [Rotaria magnacalcarata]CAF2225893.1 unnamed protein product [Rotaria magnacalcarata]
MSLTSRLESNFIREYNETFSFTDFISPSNALSSCAHSQQAELFVSRMASFISYSSEFNSLIGYKPEIKLIASRPVSVPFAHEGGAFVPTTNEVWFTANQLPIQNTNPSIITPNGANYFDDSVYICSQGNQTTSGGIYAVNPTTLVSRLVVNSWFGLRLNSPNDVTFTRKIGGGKYMWFTDPQVAYMQDFGSSPQLGSYVYRFDLTTSELRPVITDLVVPNGIAFDLNETTLYVSDTAPSSYGHGTFMVYAYDLNKHGLPINRHVFSVSSAGIPDGIKVDKMGRVWTGEGDGINVRDHHGTLLGVILGRDLCQSGVISNFAIVGNLVIILAQEKVWQLKLTTSVL